MANDSSLDDLSDSATTFARTDYHEIALQTLQNY